LRDPDAFAFDQRRLAVRAYISLEVSNIDWLWWAKAGTAKGVIASA
jgi:hypothetical protein